MAGETTIYQFEGFELDPSERRLKGPDGPVALTPKVFDTLALLVQRAGHVVSKEEIRQTVWPRGFIDDSNLTKHIWLLRRALGEEDSGPRFIETVPKLGYRFVAPVTIRTADEAVAVGHSKVGRAAWEWMGWGWPGNRSVRILAFAAVFAVLIGVIGWWLWPRGAAHSRHAGRTVAFVGFSNLSRNPKDGWIAPALTEMLSAEVNITADLHVIPDELVRGVTTQLSPPAVSGYSLPTLERLSHRLDADYIVSGSYLVSSAADEPALRVELAVQDAHSGVLLASPTYQSKVGGLTSVVNEAGVLLRDKLSTGSSPSKANLALLANAQPPTVEVARRVGFALDALQHYDAARARDELLEAIAQAPAYPLAYMHLAQAWTALGYQEKALAAAEQAARYATHLTPEQLLETQAMVAVARSDWPRAVTLYESLVRAKPLNPEYRLQSIDAQMNAGQLDEAQRSLTELRKLPGILSDPRIELAAAHVARNLDDSRGEALHASNALKLAQANEATGLIADAGLELANAQARLGQLSQARASLAAASAQYRAIHNPRGEAQAHVALGVLSATEHHPQLAREEYQTAMTLYQGIGDQAGVANVYREICDMLWNAGDRDGARTAAREGLQLAREVGDLALQGWTLRALATIAADEAASDEVVKDYQETITLSERSGNRGGHVWSLAALADIERLRGALADAQATCEQAKTEAAALTDQQFAIYSGFTCAQIQMDRGDTAGARTALNEVLRKASDTNYPLYADNARVSLAQLDMDERQWTAARDKLRGASRGFASDEAETGEAEAMAMLALCEQALGNRAEEEQAAAQARKLREGITSRQEVYLVDIALAQLVAHSQGADVEKLLRLAKDAEQRHFIAWAFEARLAAWEVLSAQGAQRAADAVRAQLRSDALKAGFGRIVELLRMEVRPH